MAPPQFSQLLLFNLSPPAGPPPHFFLVDITSIPEELLDRDLLNKKWTNDFRLAKRFLQLDKEGNQWANTQYSIFLKVEKGKQLVT